MNRAERLATARVDRSDAWTVVEVNSNDDELKRTAYRERKED